MEVVLWVSPLNQSQKGTLKKLDPGYPESVCDKGDARML